jgi:hypothetical protein
MPLGLARVPFSGWNPLVLDRPRHVLRWRQYWASRFPL